MKKLLSMLIVGLFTGLSFASANDLIGNYTFDPYVSVSIPSGVSQVYAVVDFNAGDGMDCEFYFSSYDSSYKKYFTSSYSNGSDKLIYEGTIVPVGGCNYGQSNCVEYPFSITTNILDISDNTFDNLILSTSCDHGSLDGNVSLYSVSSSSDDDNSDSLLNPGVISSGVQNGVSAFTNGLGNLIPTILLFGLPILVIVLFWNKVRSYLKRIFTRR